MPKAKTTQKDKTIYVVVCDVGGYSEASIIKKNEIDSFLLDAEDGDRLLTCKVLADQKVVTGARTLV